MALSIKTSNNLSTTITESTTGNSWRVVTYADTNTNKKRVVSVNISFSTGANDGNVNCTDANIKALHDAVVAAFQNNIGSSKGTY